MPSGEPLIDTLHRRQDRQKLVSFWRYFLWADDMRKLFHQRLFNSPIGEMRAAGATVEQALDRATTDKAFGGTVIATLYGFPYMSYYYGGMYVVIEAWQKRLKYTDPEIDDLLRSPFLASLEQHRHGAFHYTPAYVDDKLSVFIAALESEEWLSDVHAAFWRWFRFHLKLPGIVRPQ
jgi:hypothetical protein